MKDAMILKCDCKAISSHTENANSPFVRVHDFSSVLKISKIDDCNSFYVSLPNYLIRKLQLFIIRSARLIYSPPPPGSYYVLSY